MVRILPIFVIFEGTPLIHSTWAASPFMGSPFLSPFDEPMNLKVSQNIQPVGDISTWWSENSGFVDSKSFTELLADTGIIKDWLISLRS